MGLVNNKHVVLRQDAGVAGHGDTQHRVVGDDDVRLTGYRSRQLGEALVLERAGRSQALGLGHRDLCPGPV